MCTNIPHKHRDLIIAWANGAKIQYKVSGHVKWHDISDPSWDEYCSYRIKPTTVVVRYRRYLYNVGAHRKVFCVNQSQICQEPPVENELNFIKWIDNDWQEYVVEE